MAFMTKEIRGGKDLYVAEQQEKNIQIAIDNGCPKNKPKLLPNFVATDIISTLTAHQLS